MIRVCVFVMGLIFIPRCALAGSTEREVNFVGAEGARLSGTLEVPAHFEACPALVLLAGSGPTDRDGNQPPALITDLLKQIADGLAQKGVVTLRFDKRGMYANRAEMPKDMGKLGEFFSWENFVGDAESAYRFLRQQPEVDANRVGIVGHSEGGLLALQAAEALKLEGHPPAVLVLISTPGRPIDAVIMDQLKRLLGKQGATAEQTDYFLRENARITETIRETGQVPPDVPVGLEALYPSYLGKFLQSELAVNPTKLAGEFGGPVMVIAGAADVQVSPERDAKALAAALGGRKSGSYLFVTVPKGSHNLKRVLSPDEPGFAGPVAPGAMEFLQDWVHTNFLK